MSGRGAPVPGFVPSGFFVLRTPLLPFTAVTAWGDGLQAPGAVDGTDRLADAVFTDRLQLRRRLEEIVTAPEFREALFVASPSLAAAVDVWRKDPDGDRGRAAERSLVSYVMRAAARPTPFGLFAGYTAGTIGADTRLRLAGRDRYRRHTRMDMDYLWALADAVQRDRKLRDDLGYRPNSTLYETAGRLLYAEARQGPAGRSYQLVALEVTPYLLQTLARARDGERLGVLAAALVDGEITRADADAYITELVDSQVLVADIEPQLTGVPPTETMAGTLGRCEHGARLAQRLDAARAGLAAIDADGIGVPADRYRATAAVLDGLPVSPGLSRFVQVDLAKPASEPAGEVVLSSDVVSELGRGVEVLHAFSRYREDESLRRFREQFTDRFETREIPLAQALDEENGIGFGRSAAAATEAAPLPGGQADDQHVPWTRRDTLLLDKLTRALAAGDSEISVVAAEAAAEGETGPPPLPDAFEVVATVTGHGQQASARGDFQVLLQSATGPPGARLLGRFCHVDEQLLELVRSHLAAEESARPEAVFAEVVHLPEGRVGNILTRPVLRGYEIPYLGRSGAPADRQLPLSDLLVSVPGERIVLRSRRLGCEVVPRLTTAHNYSLGRLGVYRFLCALSHQGVVPAVSWDWGPLAQAPFLPRVVSGRVVLSRARWNLGGSELAAFREPRGTRQFAAIQRLRQQRRMPRYVALADGENTLMADMDSVLSLEALAHEVRRRPSASFVELPCGPDRLCASGPEGPFTHEIVVPFARSAPQPGAEPAARPAPQPAARLAPQPAAPPAPQPAARPRPQPTAESPGWSVPASWPRRFPPGSEWLYVKLYSGTATADSVLAGAIRPLVPSLAEAGADRWFFIRYADPHSHLRLRIHGAPDRLLHETQPLLHRVTAPLLETGQLWRVQFDTYEREVERYGGDEGIRLAEHAFHADSAAVLAIVAQLTGDAGADLRWRAAVRGIDLLFDDLRLTLEQKRAIARQARRSYGREFGAGPEFSREAGRWYRNERPFLEALLDPQRDPPPELAGAMAALHQRSTALAPAAAQLAALADAGRLSAGIGELAMSLAHMHVNRMLRSAQRAQELVLYELLDRAYSSQAARRSR